MGCCRQYCANGLPHVLAPEASGEWDSVVSIVGLSSRGAATRSVARVRGTITLIPASLLLTKSCDLVILVAMKTVNVHQAKTHLSRLIERAHGGEEIVIAKSGTPYARLVPLQTRQPERRSGTLKGAVEITKSFFEPLPQEWGGED